MRYAWLCVGLLVIEPRHERVREPLVPERGAATLGNSEPEKPRLVGRKTFAVLSRVEWGLALVVLMLLPGLRKPAALAGAGVAIAVVMVETLWLLPILDDRVGQMIGGRPPAGLEAARHLYRSRDREALRPLGHRIRDGTSSPACRGRGASRPIEPARSVVWCVRPTIELDTEAAGLDELRDAAINGSNPSRTTVINPATCFEARGRNLFLLSNLQMRRARWWARIDPRQRYGEAFWRAHHEAWKRSDLNQREYCEAQDIPLKAFGN